MITGAETAGLVGRPSPIYLEGRLPLLLQAKDVMALGLRDGQMVKPTIEVRQEQLKMVLFNRVFDLPAGLRAQAGDVLSMQVQVLANGSAQLRSLMSVKNTPIEEPPSATTATRADQLAVRPQSGLALKTPSRSKATTLSRSLPKYSDGPQDAPAFLDQLG